MGGRKKNRNVQREKRRSEGEGEEEREGEKVEESACKENNRIVFTVMEEGRGGRRKEN